MSALALEGVDVDLGGRPVLRDVSLEVEPGALVGLLGPNGAGKTTLLRTVLGLVRPRAGTIEVRGASGRGRRSTIGYVPQRHQFAWDFPISVERAVLSGRTGALGLLRRPGASDWKATSAAVARVGLDALRERPVGQLSGGQRQRVLVARALALGAPVLLLDEPFTGLDLPTQELLTRLFVELAAEGRAVLLTTHDLLGALTTCDRVALLNRTVVASGRPDELRDPSVWMHAFGVDERSPLLRLLEVV